MLSRLGVPRLGRSHLYHGRLVSVRCQFGWPSFCQAVDVLVDRAEARCALTTYAALAMAERSRGGGRVRQVEAEGLVVDLDVQPIAGPGRLHRGRLLTRTAILEHVWDYDFEGGGNLVEVYVGNLRRKLGDRRRGRLHRHGPRRRLPVRAGGAAGAEEGGTAGGADPGA